MENKALEEKRYRLDILDDYKSKDGVPIERFYIDTYCDEKTVKKMARVYCMAKQEEAYIKERTNAVRDYELSLCKSL